MGASLVQNMPVKYKFTMRRPLRRRRGCLSSLLFIPYLKFPLTITIYHGAPRAMKQTMHHASRITGAKFFKNSFIQLKQL